MNDLKAILAQCRRVNDCLIWLGGVDHYGYGRITIEHKRYRVHRVMYEMVYNPIPDNKVIMHSCDIPNCVEPEHLSVGTQYENIMDAFRKGRNGSAYGEKQSNTILTAEKVIAIREEHKRYHSLKELAKKYGVSVSSINQIVRGKRWNHLISK